MTAVPVDRTDNINIQFTMIHKTSDRMLAKLLLLRETLQMTYGPIITAVVMESNVLLQTVHQDSPNTFTSVFQDCIASGLPGSGRSARLTRGMTYKCTYKLLELKQNGLNVDLYKEDVN